MNKFTENMKKVNERLVKARAARLSKAKALPAVTRVFLNANYVNPITLGFPSGTVVFEIKNRSTGRKDYYDKQTFFKLMKMLKGSYDLLMRDPKVPIPGARNPMTRGPIYPRNIRRVAVVAKKKTPSPATAAKRIQNVVRKRKSKSLKK
jgi:hypothetical protein